MRLLLCAVLLLVCAAPAAAAPVLGPQAYYGTRLSGPLSEDVEPANPGADYHGEPLALETSYVGRKAIEPTLAFDREGNGFFPASYFEDPVYGVGGHSYLLRSKDNGRTWENIEPATQAGFDPPRDLDPWVYGEPVSGRVFDIGLLLAGSFLSYSDDGGETWTSSLMTDPGVNDHQSIVAAVPPPGNPVLTPTDPSFPKILYYCVNEVTRAGCAVSRDGGRAWTSMPGSPYLGVSAGEGDQGLIGPVCSALTGQLQADHEGRVFLPSGHCGQPYVAITEDGGLTWEQVLVSKHIRAADTHTEMAADAAGNLYYVWQDPVHWLPWLATSTDHGRTWSDPLMIAPPGVWAANLPTIVAGEEGRIAITLTGSTTADEEDGTRPWNAYVIVSTNALSSEPLFLSTIGNRAGDPMHRGGCRGRCGGVFDFADIQLNPLDGAVWATSSDSCTAERECNAAYEGDIGANAAVDAQGMVLRQIGGPRLVGPLPPPVAAPALPAQPGGPAQIDRRKPRVRLSMTRRVFRGARRAAGRRVSRARTHFVIRLDEGGTAAIRISRVGGRRVGVLRTSVARGANRLAFTGRAGRRTLRPGRYRAVALVRDPAGNIGRSKPVSFRVR